MVCSGYPCSICECMRSIIAIISRLMRIILLMHVISVITHVGCDVRRHGTRLED